MKAKRAKTLGLVAHDGGAIQPTSRPGQVTQPSRRLILSSDRKGSSDKSHNSEITDQVGV